MASLTAKKVLGQRHQDLFFQRLQQIGKQRSTGIITITIIIIIIIQSWVKHISNMSNMTQTSNSKEP
jgi:hypothetical protein